MEDHPLFPVAHKIVALRYSSELASNVSCGRQHLCELSNLLCQNYAEVSALQTSSDKVDRFLLSIIKASIRHQIEAFGACNAHGSDLEAELGGFHVELDAIFSVITESRKRKLTCSRRSRSLDVKRTGSNSHEAQESDLLEEHCQRGRHLYPSRGLRRTKSDRGISRRPNFTRDQLIVIYSWFFENRRHPYPSDAEKQDLCFKSGLSLKQLNDWFINGS
ncbi:hypothetical protein PhCBS80983_g05925 [Powellomyces hirtus]|uniref:Homeobox domain-containing protein n=1 Tax=Powellomyces hirtus TaxID=109895 RepID=A0A507DU49_9FUNG|nr:hypothetical protein PhCBS80983_g05925 [Powellomyces hirtus]